MTKLRRWITNRYEQSAWARGALVLAVFTLNFMVVLVFFTRISNPWIGAPLLILWTLLLAGFFTWLITARHEE